MAWLLKPSTVLLGAASIIPQTLSAPLQSRDGLQVHISVADDLLETSVDGHVMLMFATAGVDPLDNWDVVDTPNALHGKNVFTLSSSDPVTLAGGSRRNTHTGVYGFPNVSIDAVPAGAYSVQAFLNQYETVKRSDGSEVKVRFPCGDGAPPVDGYGTLQTSLVNVTVTGSSQTIDLVLNEIVETPQFNGTEIGGCSQGNYEETANLKYVKIRSDVLSEFWGRDMYVGANVLLPAGYDADDQDTRYPVLYHQNHWDAGNGAYDYSDDEEFASAWDAGVIPGTNVTAERPTPKMILVQFRHETPFYDDSYAVNTANLGPYGDAINDELLPVLDEMFNTIAEPYARIQDGGSTGGWESAASVVFRPDLFGACFSSYPDSLDFHAHQAIPLYTNDNAYDFINGTAIPSIQDHNADGVQEILATVRQENHWELSFGTSSRSFLQWDIWQAVFGVQGYNSYPLEAWDKVNGKIYPGAVEYWKHMDLSNYITSNWDNELNLGEVLKHRIFVYVGTWDTYFLNFGVMEFEANVNGRGGAGWANITYIEEAIHGGNYQLRDTWDYLELVYSWVEDHAPDGKTPLSADVTTEASRGNKWEDVLAYGGHQAAIDRQADPEIDTKGYEVSASVGRWDPGMKLEAVWLVKAKPSCKPFAVEQGDVVAYRGPRNAKGVQVAVTGTKRGYEKETRKSGVVDIK